MRRTTAATLRRGSFSPFASSAFLSSSSSSSSLLSTQQRAFASSQHNKGGRLSGRKAVVTGSTAGIGLAIAKELAKAGASIVLNGFGDPSEIEKIRSELETLYHDGKKEHVIYVPADLSKPSEIASMMDTVYNKFGSIDILVNNAGIQHVSPIDTFPVEKWDLVINLNLSAVFHTMRLALPKMKENGYGRVINISSAHGLVASKHKSAYVAAKHGVVGLTKVAALEYAGSGVTCNCINPGWVLTDLVKKQIDAIAEQKKISWDAAAQSILQEKQPSLKFVQAQDLGELAVFLCSEGTSQMTGICLPVDGGWTAQ